MTNMLKIVGKYNERRINAKKYKLSSKIIIEYNIDVNAI